MPAPTKSTAAEMELRVGFVFEALITGVLAAEMYGYALQNRPDWHVSRMTVWRYMSLAKKRLEAIARPRQEMQLGKSLARLELLFQRNMLVQDYSTALQAEKERNKLLGLYAPVKSAVDVTSGGKKLPVPEIRVYTGAPPLANSEKDIAN